MTYTPKRLSSAAYDWTSTAKLKLKADTGCASEGYSAISGGNTLPVSYTDPLYAAAICVQVTAPMSGDLNSGVNQFMIKADTSGGLGAGKGVIVRFFKGSDTLSSGLFWMSDSSWVPQDEWNYTDAYGNPLGPNNFSIVHNKTKITATNPGQFYVNFWLPNVTASDFFLEVAVPDSFGLSADTNGVSTKVYVGSSNISFADPSTQQEYKRNHEFSISVGQVTGQDVYMTVHLTYTQSGTSGLLPYPSLNPYTFQGFADPDGDSDWELVNDISTTINGVLKK